MISMLIHEIHVLTLIYIDLQGLFYGEDKKFVKWGVES